MKKRFLKELLEEMGISAEIACYLGEAAEYFTQTIEKLTSTILAIFM